VIGLYEQEIVSTEAHLRLKKQQTKTDGGCVGIDKQGNPITDIKQATAGDVARKEADERKEAINEARFRLCQEIDSALNSKQLLLELEKRDAQLALQLKQQQDHQRQKLEAKREQLQQRRFARVRTEQNEKCFRAKVEAFEEEEKDKRKISEEFIRKVFKNAKRSDTEDIKERRFELLNEFLSDQYSDALADLLSRQFYETDALMKQTMQKYMDEVVAESSSIKQHF